MTYDTYFGLATDRNNLSQGEGFFCGHRQKIAPSNLQLLFLSQSVYVRLVGQFVVEELPVVVGRICDGVMGLTVSFS